MFTYYVVTNYQKTLSQIDLSISFHVKYLFLFLQKQPDLRKEAQNSWNIAQQQMSSALRQAAETAYAQGKMSSEQKQLFFMSGIVDELLMPNQKKTMTFICYIYHKQSRSPHSCQSILYPFISTLKCTALNKIHLFFQLPKTKSPTALTLRKPTPTQNPHKTRVSASSAKSRTSKITSGTQTPIALLISTTTP